MDGEDTWRLLRDADQRLADEREQHRAQLREADMQLATERDKAYGIHFRQLNENAARTIEERGHFVSVESFDPFQKQVLAFMAREGGITRGSDRAIAWAIAGMSTLIAIVSIVVGVILASP